MLMLYSDARAGRSPTPHLPPSHPARAILLDSDVRVRPMREGLRVIPVFILFHAHGTACAPWYRRYRRYRRYRSTVGPTLLFAIPAP